MPTFASACKPQCSLLRCCQRVGCHRRASSRERNAHHVSNCDQNTRGNCFRDAYEHLFAICQCWTTWPSMSLCPFVGRAAVERPRRRDSLTMMPLAAIRSSEASIKFDFAALILSHQFSIHREITVTVYRFGAVSVAGSIVSLPYPWSNCSCRPVALFL